MEKITIFGRHSCFTLTRCFSDLFQAVRNLPPELVLSVQRKTLLSQQEKDVLATIKANRVCYWIWFMLKRFNWNCFLRFITSKFALSLLFFRYFSVLRFPIKFFLLLSSFFRLKVRHWTTSKIWWHLILEFFTLPELQNPFCITGKASNNTYFYLIR